MYKRLGKATALLNLQESTSGPESDQDEDDSSDEEDPWLNAGAQPGVPALRAHGISEAEVSNGHAAEYRQERNTYDPDSWAYALALAEQDGAVGHTASKSTNLATPTLRRDLRVPEGLATVLLMSNPRGSNRWHLIALSST